MPDFASELKQAVLSAIEREIDRDSSQRGISIRAPGAIPGTIQGEAVAETEAPGFVFATGYDGSDTLVGFMFDFSEFDGSDVLT